MKLSLLSLRCVLAAAALSLQLVGSTFQAQQKPSSDKPAEDVVRVSTDLVQTSVMVFDKQSRFVENLKPEQFELRLDGAPVTISFVERVTAGTVEEERLRQTSAGRITAGTRPAAATYRGRTIIFFIDDLHLSAESTQRTRKTILEFVENQIGTGDQVAIASPSGQIGFLQQFTDVVPALRAAIARLHHRPYTVRDSENIPMTEYTAVQIAQGDKFVLEYYSSELLKATNFNAGGGLGPSRSGPFGGRPNAGMTPGITRDVADRMVRERAQLLLKQSAIVTHNTLTTLESLMKTSSQMTGNKVVFFISDGFYLNDRETGLGEKLRLITDAATRAGVVIYTVDARGLVSTTDATSNRADPAGLVSRSNVGEIAASQDALTILADDTGGRASLNTGALGALVKDALQETSNYYLLGWKPKSDEQKTRGYKRIEVSIVGRPELTVRLPRGFILGGVPESETGGVSSSKSNPPVGAAKGPEAELRVALGLTSPKKGLATQVSTAFLDLPGIGLVLSTSMQMATDVLSYGPDDKQAAAIDVAGVVLNDQGKQVGGFKTRINVNPLAKAAGASMNPGVIYNHKLPLPPGLYQVRVAARDDKSGRVGGATEWIEIPDLASKQLTLSSLLVGGQFIGSGQKQAGSASEQLQFSVDRRFARGAHLNFLSIIYNAARASSGAPELEAQIKISRGGQAIVTSPLRKVVVEAGADATRIPYGADIALQTLPAGRYLLQVTVADRVAKTSASQQVSFEIE
ncbi:MAG: VWA domain-containing protein [Acidobacteriota bacterium]